MSDEHQQMLESAEPTSKQALIEIKKQNELLEIQIRLLDRICTLKEEQQANDNAFRDDWYDSKDKQAKQGKRTLFFSAAGVLIALVALPAVLFEAEVRYSLVTSFLSYWGF